MLSSISFVSFHKLRVCLFRSASTIFADDDIVPSQNQLHGIFRYFQIIGRHSAFWQFLLSAPEFTGPESTQYLLYLSLGSGVVADAIMAPALCIVLAKSRTGFRRSVPCAGLTTLWSGLHCSQNWLTHQDPDGVYDQHKSINQVSIDLCMSRTLLKYDPQYRRYADLDPGKFIRHIRVQSPYWYYIFSHQQYAAMPNTYVFLAFFFNLSKCKLAGIQNVTKISILTI
jgi:hypothetical protein